MADRTEEARLDALRKLDLLDTPPSEAFDRITRMAGQLFDLPIAAVSLTDSDRQWFKSRVGVEHTSIPRDKAPCAQVAESADVLVIPDLLADSCYGDSLLARSGVRFYAGAPLVTREGFGLGAMCVLGSEPRQASASELASLADLAAMVMAQIELRHAFGRVDPLSGLPNRNQFVEDLDDLARERPRGERRLAVLVDLAGPEQLGDVARVMGPAYLDGMVDEAARAIRAMIGPARKAYHVGATQFALLAPPGVEEGAYTALLARKLDGVRAAAASRFVTTTTVGVAPFALGETAPRDVLRIAHSAAQDARGTQSKIFVHSPDRDAAHRRRFALLDAFGAALEGADQLRLVYQPRVDLASGACVGAEALLRWRHPELGEVSPGEFMPIVERTSMARAATAWVLDAALARLAAWRDAGLALQLSVNVSATNLLEADFAERVARGLARHALAAERLELEVTESAVMEDAERALVTLEAVAGGGTRLAIDDFGTGYSSLAYLQRLPAHVVKIDRSFVRGLAADGCKRSLVATMASLAHGFGYRVVAEGIETAGELGCVRAAACDEGQGYLFARPLEPEGFAAWLRDPEGGKIAADGGGLGHGSAPPTAASGEAAADPASPPSRPQRAPATPRFRAAAGDGSFVFRRLYPARPRHRAAREAPNVDPGTTETTTLHRLVYCSRNAIADARADVAGEVERILVASRRNNRREGITGALLYSEGCFAQVLEGPLAAVERTFGRIRCDFRHADVVVLGVGPVEARMFGDWSMAYARALGPRAATRLGLKRAFTEPGSLAAEAVMTQLRDVVRGQEGGVPA